MIEIVERATLETKQFNLDFKNNKDLDTQTRRDTGKSLPPKNDSDINRNTEDLAKYPVVYIDGVMIQSNQIIKLELFNDSFVPSLKLSFSDPTSKLIDENYPLDNSIISIFKESPNKDLMAIKMDFKITDFTIIKGKKDSEGISFELDGIVDVDGFYLNNFESYKGSSYKVIKDLSKNLGLGFATNVTTTNDEMVWINPSNYRIKFMKEIIERSYINDDTFLFGYIDFYYNFNYVDIEEQLKDDISNQMNMMDREQLIKDGKDDKTPLILTNDEDAKSTNMYISKYTILNSSTNINLQYGYRNKAIYYIKSEDQIKRYDLDNITNDGDNKIALKGNPDDKNGLYENMISNTYMGKMDTDNVHKEYLHTLLQNQNNLKFLQKLKMTIKLTRPNFSLYRFQKVLVELYNIAKLSKSNELKVVDDKNVGRNDEKIINKLSGEWLITAINFTFSKEEGNYQEITLVKRELTDKYTFPRRKTTKDEINQKSEPKSRVTEEEKVNNIPDSKKNIDVKFASEKKKLKN